MFYKNPSISHLYNIGLNILQYTMLFCKWYHTIFNIPVGITGPLVLDIPVSETWQSPTSWYIVKQSQWHSLTFFFVGWGAVYIMTKPDINV